MRVVDMIAAKRDGKELTAEELEWLINGYVRGEVPDYQMSAWLMAVYFRGMSERETAAYTQALVNSGDILDLSSLSKPVIDKHSSGGVGDKTTLILAPLVASAGVPVAKMSGRGLGHTGGTIDKLESIPGYRVSMTIAEFIRQVERVGLSVISQTGRLVPGDKLLYALRDVTATVESIPLIAASIMSKKIASGATGIVLDVKTGNGAFMQDVQKAKTLARSMVEIGHRSGRKAVALITSMDQPLGQAVGNALEVKEAFQALQGDCPADLKELCLALGAEMLVLAGKAETAAEGKDLLRRLWEQGEALRTAEKWIQAQGGDPRVVSHTELLPLSPVTKLLQAAGSGFIAGFNTLEVGRAAVLLGAGRSRKEDPVDAGAGIYLYKKTGDPVAAGDDLAIVYAGDHARAEAGVAVLEQAIEIASSLPQEGRLLLEKVI